MRFKLKQLRLKSLVSGMGFFLFSVLQVLSYTYTTFSNTKETIFLIKYLIMEPVKKCHTFLTNK